MGGPDTEITEATTTVALEIAWFEPMPIAQTVNRLGLRSEASARFERGVDPYGIDTAQRPVRRAARRDVPRPRRPRRRGRRARRLAAAGRALVRGAHQPGQPDPRHVARGRDLPPLLDPIGYTVSGDGDVLDGRAAVVAPRLHRGDRRRRGGRPPLRLRPRRQGAARRRRCTAGCPCASSAGAGCARCCSVSASTKRCPTRSWPPTARARPVSTATPCASPTRSWPTRACCARRCGPGCCGPIAFNESHRRTGVALFEIGHVYPPGPGELPAEYEALGVVLAGEEAPAAVAVWREIAAAMGVGARIDQGRVPAGLHPTRSATLVAGRDADRRRRRDPSRRARGLRHHGAGRVLELDLRRCSPRAEAGGVEADQPVPVERPRPRVRAARRRAGGEAGQGHPPGGGGAARRPRAVRRVPGAGIADGTRSLAYRLRLQAPDRTLTDADVADVREKVRQDDEQAGRRAARLMEPSPRSSASRRPVAAAGCRAGCGSWCRCSCRDCCSGRSPWPCARAVTTTASRSRGPARSCRPSSVPPTT